MKAINQFIVLFCTVCLMTTVACTSEDPGPKVCKTVEGQITTSAGSATGNDGYSLGVGPFAIKFSNVNLTFYGLNGIEIADVGEKCLDEITTYPGGGTLGRITVFEEHAYVAKQGDTYSKFVVDDYRDGVVTVTYVGHL